ncbi:hypothetical protein PI124_g9568 [Phytophthora idaei]|nr:hypothetical protein PI125_g9406 [Phytophthora idaei]KAG3245692.1 hypothetical protein PI124_g9568 [Phytophthora idaei]
MVPELSRQQPKDSHIDSILEVESGLHETYEQDWKALNQAQAATMEVIVASDGVLARTPLHYR